MMHISTPIADSLSRSVTPLLFHFNNIIYCLLLVILIVKDVRAHLGFTQQLGVSIRLHK